MKMVKRYVVNAKLRLTTGMVVSGIGAILLGVLIYLLLTEYQSGYLFHWTSTDYVINISGFAISIFFIWLGRYGDKKQEWPECIIEIYDNGLMHYIMRYKSGSEIYNSWILMDRIVARYYKKKYYKRKKNWYIDSQFGFTDGNKIYGIFFYGWVKEPRNISEFDRLIEEIDKLIEENKKRLNLKKVPHTVTWYGVSSWEETEEAQKIKEEMRKKLRKESDGESPNARTD